MIIETLLAVYLTAYACYEYVTRHSLKKQLTAHPDEKLSLYLQTIALLWAPVIVLALAIHFWELKWTDVGIPDSPSMSLLFTAVALILFVVILAIQHRMALTNPASVHTLKQLFSQYNWFLPVNESEKRWFIYGLSVSAGICEELLFRGFLLYYFSSTVGVIGAVAISSVLFGLCHAYQGNSYIVRTALIGAVLCAVYLLSGSLILVIGIHIAIDVNSGLLAYRILSANRNNCATSPHVA